MTIPHWKFLLIDWLPAPKRIRLQITANLVAKSYDADILAAKERKDYESVAGIESEASWQLQEYSDAETSLLTRHLRAKASRLGVKEPALEIVDGDNVDKNWYRSNWTAEWLLTPLGVDFR